MKGSNGPMKQPPIPRFDSKYGPKMNVHSENPQQQFILDKVKKKKKKK